MRFLFFIAVALSCSCLQAQIVRQPLSLFYQSSGAYSLHFADLFSAVTNQASLAGLQAGGFGAYGERRFMLSELSGYHFIAAVPFSSGTFGLQATYLGSEAFNENEFGLIYARKISSVVDVGVKFNYYTVHVAGFGNASSVNFEGGVTFHLTDKIHAGIHVYNPTESKIGKSGIEKLASVYKAGVGYEASQSVFLSAEIVKSQGLPINVNAALQYNFSKKIFIRTGVSANTNNSYANVGMQLNFATLNVQASYHPQLGFTPGLSLLVNFKKPAEE